MFYDAICMTRVYAQEFIDIRVRHAPAG